MKKIVIPSLWVSCHNTIIFRQPLKSIIVNQSDGSGNEQRIEDDMKQRLPGRESSNHLHSKGDIVLPCHRHKN